MIITKHQVLEAVLRVLKVIFAIFRTLVVEFLMIFCTSEASSAIYQGKSKPVIGKEKSGRATESDMDGETQRCAEPEMRVPGFHRFQQVLNGKFRRTGLTFSSDY